MNCSFSIIEFGIVFLKDVSKETLEDLITFIYSGQVDVKQEHLEDFFQTAKALDIKGLTAGGYANSDDMQPTVPNSFVKQTFEGAQYQSTRTIPVPNQTKSKRSEPSQYETQINQHQHNYEYDVVNEFNVNSNEYGDYFGSVFGDGVSTAKDREYSIDDLKFGAEKKPAKTYSAMAKRAKTDIGQLIRTHK